MKKRFLVLIVLLLITCATATAGEYLWSCSAHAYDCFESEAGDCCNCEIA